MSKKFIERYQTMSKSIAAYREKRELTQPEFATRMHCSKAFIKQLESLSDDKQTHIWMGKNLDILFRIGDVLQMDVIAFFNPITKKYRTDKEKPITG